MNSDELQETENSLTASTELPPSPLDRETVEHRLARLEQRAGLRPPYGKVIHEVMCS